MEDCAAMAGKATATDGFDESRRSFGHRPHDHQACVAEALGKAALLCDRRGARLTELRRQVLELVWRSHAPVGAYEVLGRLKQRGGKPAAPPTVYRALDFLLENGLIHRLESLNAYIGCPHPEQRHTSQFLICRDCGGVAEIYDPGMAAAVSTSAAAAGFVVSRLTIELQGLCPRCRGEPSLQ
jgi:Fur family zinc uptake transcriptional regulator